MGKFNEKYNEITQNTNNEQINEDITREEILDEFLEVVNSRDMSTRIESSPYIGKGKKVLAFYSETFDPNFVYYADIKRIYMSK